MKKLLYITVNSKPEKLSASKPSKSLINKFFEKYPNFIEEVDLYKEHIPRLNMNILKIEIVLLVKKH